jgi:peptidoglycan/xylan/chitin deacetylase (PgdA/CDA1 family)
MSRYWTLASLAAGSVVAYGLPSVTAWDPIRVRAFPNLSGRGTPSQVAVTFDDGPDPASTPAILACLEQLGWTATFFMLGAMVTKAPTLAAEVADAGHEIALHGHDHHNVLTRSPQRIEQDLRRGLDAVTSATGRTPRWYRPPQGILSTPALFITARHGLRTVLWTDAGRDWRADATPSSVVASVRAGLAGGATVLLHDSDCTSAAGAWRATLGALPRLAELFSERGLTPGPLAAHGLLDDTPPHSHSGST